MSAYSVLILAEPSLVSYWRLGETSGTNAVDQKAAHAGTYTGGFTLNQTGLLNADADPSVDLNGSTGYVTAGTINLGTAGWSIEAWVNADTFSGNGDAIAGIELSPMNAASLAAWGVSGRQLYVSASVGGAYHGPLGPDLSTGVTYHVVATGDPAVGTKLYVNGALVGTDSATGALVANNTFIVGAYPFDHASRFWDGRIDEVAVYNAALSSSSILSHYNTGAGIVAGHERNLLGIGT